MNLDTRPEPEQPSDAYEEQSISLRSQLLNWLLIPFFVLFLFSSAIGYFATLKYANRPYDAALLKRAQLLESYLKLGRDGAAVLELPAGDRKVFFTGPDRLFFTVSYFSDDLIDGNTNLPVPRALEIKKAEPVFDYIDLEGVRLRRLSLVHALDPGKRNVEVVVQLAERIETRQILTRDILANIVVPQLLMIVLSVAAVSYGVPRALASLDKLRREVAKRSRHDLSFLNEERAPDEVRPLIHAVNDLLLRLTRVLDSQKRFIADAAHQLRTPFAGIKTQAELALRETDPQRMHHSLELILTSAERGVRLVNQLLSLARSEPGAGQLMPFRVLDLNRLVRDCTMEWVPEALRKDIDLGFEGWRERVDIRGDEKTLTEIVGNLIDNAIRYTQAGGKVTVTVGREWGVAKLCVEDNGPGIAPEHRDKVFERFYRVMDSGVEGSGLGLPIVQEVVKGHGGSIMLADGEGGRGALFVIRFPIAPVENSVFQRLD